jgi:hypothetical protein
MTSNDRREFQRLHLAKPILGLLDNGNALILDIGIGGALIEHHGQAQPGERIKLLFRWRAHDVQFVCEVVRSRVTRERPGMQTVTSHTALHFVEPVGSSADHLIDMMATFVGKVLSAQRSNAHGAGGGPDAMTLAQIGAARRARSEGWISYRWNGAEWKVTPAMNSVQPDDGFTVAAYEDEDELQTLCATYETADEEGRSLIRLVAELSSRGAKPVRA